MARVTVAAELATERLRLRPSRADDLPAVHGLWTEPHVRRFLFDGRILSVDEVRAFLDASSSSFLARGFGIWLVFERGVLELAGFAGLLESSQPIPNLVYGLRPELCGRGLASEAARAVLRHTLGDLKLPAVMADVDEPNLASVRVLERLGMTRVRRAIVNGRPLLYYERRGEGVAA